MTSSFFLGAGLLLLAVAIAVLLRKLQLISIREAGVQERCAAKESEAANLHARLTQMQADNDSVRGDNQTFREDIARLQTSLDLERKQFDEKLSLLNESREQLGAAFKNLANEIFEDKSKNFLEKNKDSLAAILSPLQEKITQFEKRVEETYDKESKERFSLAKEIKNLQELNNKISADAINLTNALKGDNKAQGSWGEFILESVLEKSGLVKGREYEVQASLEAEDGTKYQPDVIVHLPESRDLIIDAKVSLKAWDAFCSSDESPQREELLKEHLQSIRQHVKSLSAKDYQNLAGINSLDYVFLFMPIEAAYFTAIQNDPELSLYAFDRNIIFVGPTTLLTTLKTVQNLWRLAQQNLNAKEIAERAGALYDKFVAFVEDLDDVGTKIDASKKSFERAHNKLQSGRGNLIKRVETLKQLGAKTAKKHKSALLSSALEEDETPTALSSESADGASEEDCGDKTRH